MFSVAKILELLPEKGSLEIKKLEKMLRITKKIERNHLGIAVSALTKLGVLELENEESIRSYSSEKFIKAKIRCSSKGYCFAVREDGQEDIYIREQFLNHAWHGDRVLVKIEKEALRRKSPEGSVVCILERNRNKVLANLVNKNEDISAVPIDERILSVIDIPNEDSRFTIDNENIVEVAIEKYPIAQFNAVGKVIRKLSLNEGCKGDVEIIKSKFCINDNTQTPKISLKKPNEKYRRDLTAQDVCLFNSWQSKEHPSLLGIYCEPFKGGIKAWIHIPTVSERIVKGSKLDDWIKSRVDSKCLGDKWINLLSDSLLKEASFQINKESDSITLLINIDKSGEIYDWEFFLSKISPKLIIDDNILELITNRNPKSRTLPVKLKPIKDLINIIDLVLYLTDILNSKHKENGLLEFISKENELENLYDHQTNIPGRDFHSWKPRYNKQIANSIVDTLTITANKILFKHLTDLKIEMLYLSSKPIDQLQYNEVIKSAIALNAKIELDQDGFISLPHFIKSIVNNPNQRVIEKLLKNIIPEQRYNIYNFSQHEVEPHKTNYINDIYQAPWASPTINYGDILNQFLLIELINKSKTKTSSKIEKLNSQVQKSINNKSSNSSIESIACSIREITNENVISFLNTERARSNSFNEGLISIIEARAIDKIINHIVEGTITGVQSYGLFVEINSFESEGLVHVSTLTDDWYEYRSRQNMLIGRKNKKTYQLGDKIKIKVISVDFIKNQIDLEVAEDIKELPVTKNEKG